MIQVYEYNPIDNSYLCKKPISDIPRYVTMNKAQLDELTHIHLCHDFLIKHCKEVL